MKTEKTFEFIDTPLDISVKWRDWVYYFREIALQCGRKNAQMAAKGLRVGNMYTHRNLVSYEGKLIKYPTQSGEVVNSFTLTYLN